ncbi:quinone-dependent dihydroorotate dehydrogenase [Candidatus Pacearchaeota archaeon CG10_big_fil_rev_8_21_14_0_10_31_24]|nr:MAG: quinone-dependent dihydroorotate dehydrogenase [Candidatus Pacearchaeota archaeon CG10_big_fil_rev_8_21_14_0_10_31_24]
MSVLFGLKRKVNNSVYTYCVKPICFSQDPEKVHNFFISSGKNIGAFKLGKKVVRGLFNYQNKILEQEILGINFRNPVGLSAGFDKNAELISIMEDVGFGFVEVGSVSAKQCDGNSGIRLKRIPEKKGIWVNLGLCNNGSLEISNRLKGKNFKIPFGVSIARTNCAEVAETSEGIKDYVRSFEIFKEKGVGNYITINISCPNAYGGQPFSDSKRFESLIKEVVKVKIGKPIFVKMSPDLSSKNLDEIIRISRKYKIQGFICSNLTKEKGKPRGGFSGKIVEEKADKLLEYFYRKTKGEFVLIGVGGIFSAEDVYRKIRKGASLVQLVTGMIYQGPGLIGQINYDLVNLLRMDGFNSIEEARGVDVK